MSGTLTMMGTSQKQCSYNPDPHNELHNLAMQSEDDIMKYVFKIDRSKLHGYVRGLLLLERFEKDARKKDKIKKMQFFVMVEHMHSHLFGEVSHKSFCMNNSERSFNPKTYDEIWNLATQNEDDINKYILSIDHDELIDYKKGFQLLKDSQRNDKIKHVENLIIIEDLHRWLFWKIRNNL